MHQQELRTCLDAVAGETFRANASALVLVRQLAKCMWLPDAQPDPWRTLRVACARPRNASDASPASAPGSWNVGMVASQQSM